MLDLIKKNKKILGIGVILFVGYMYIGGEKVETPQNSELRDIIYSTDKSCERVNIEYFKEFYDVLPLKKEKFGNGNLTIGVGGENILKEKEILEVPKYGNYLLSDGVFFAETKNVIKVGDEKKEALNSDSNRVKFVCFAEFTDNERKKSIEENIKNNFKNEIEKKIFFRDYEEIYKLSFAKIGIEFNGKQQGMGAMIGSFILTNIFNKQ